MDNCAATTCRKRQDQQEEWILLPNAIPTQLHCRFGDNSFKQAQVETSSYTDLEDGTREVP